MELSNWAPEHSDALRELIAKGLSFSEAAQAINSRIQYVLLSQCRAWPRAAPGAEAGRSPETVAAHQAR